MGLRSTNVNTHRVAASPRRQGYQAMASFHVFMDLDDVQIKTDIPKLAPFSYRGYRSRWGLISNKIRDQAGSVRTFVSAHLLVLTLLRIHAALPSVSLGLGSDPGQWRNNTIHSSSTRTLPASSRTAYASIERQTADIMTLKNPSTASSPYASITPPPRKGVSGSVAPIQTLRWIASRFPPSASRKAKNAGSSAR